MNSEPELIASQTTTHCNLASISDSLSDNNQFKYDSIEKKAVHLRLILEKDFKAADLKWSLFVAAAFSFRYETCLRPFPPLFLRDGSKDMDALLSLITDVPALDLLLQRLDDLENLVNICDIIDLLFFVLVRLREPNIKSVPYESHEAILNIVNSPSASTAPSSKPQYVFQIISSPKSKVELQWKELAKNHRTFHAFYEGRLEHFYSILNLGFNKYLYKKTALGSGIYLSPLSSTSLSYGLGGFGWGASCLGSHLCCVAICEVIDAPDGINYQTPSSTQGDRKNLDDKSGAGENLESRSNYFVTNCELVRIRYLLVYAKQPSSRIPTSGSIRDGGAVQQWVGRHKLFSVLLGYGLMLATIGFANNQPIQFYYEVLLKKLVVAINTMKA